MAGRPRSGRPGGGGAVAPRPTAGTGPPPPQPRNAPGAPAAADPNLARDGRRPRPGPDRIRAAASHSISAVLPEPPSTMLPPACAFDPPLQCRTVILPADSGRDSHEER